MKIVFVIRQTAVGSKVGKHYDYEFYDDRRNKKRTTSTQSKCLPTHSLCDKLSQIIECNKKNNIRKNCHSKRSTTFEKHMINSNQYYENYKN